MTNGMPQGMKTTMGWVLGVAIIAMILLIMVIVFGNLSGQTGIAQSSSAYVNQTIEINDDGAIPAGADNRVNGVIVASSVLMTNTSADSTVFPSTNYTLSGVTFTSATAEQNNTNVNVSYTVNYDGPVLRSFENIITNYTRSATNTTSQFPTVGTIIGIAVLLLVLIALLVYAIRSMMGIAGTTTLGTGGSKDSRGKFGGSSTGSIA